MANLRLSFFFVNKSAWIGIAFEEKIHKNISWLRFYCLLLCNVCSDSVLKDTFDSGGTMKHVEIRLRNQIVFASFGISHKQIEEDV